MKPWVSALLAHASNASNASNAALGRQSRRLGRPCLLDVVEHALNPSFQRATEDGFLCFQGQPSLHNEFQDNQRIKINTNNVLGKWTTYNNINIAQAHSAQQEAPPATA